MATKPDQDQSTAPKKRGSYKPVGEQKSRTEVVALGPKAAAAMARRKRSTSAN